MTNPSDDNSKAKMPEGPKESKPDNVEPDANKKEQVRFNLDTAEPPLKPVDTSQRGSKVSNVEHIPPESNPNAKEITLCKQITKMVLDGLELKISKSVTQHFKEHATTFSNTIVDRLDEFTKNHEETNKTTLKDLTEEAVKMSVQDKLMPLIKEAVNDFEDRVFIPRSNIQLGLIGYRFIPNRTLGKYVLHYEDKDDEGGEVWIPVKDYRQTIFGRVEGQPGVTGEPLTHPTKPQSNKAREEIDESEEEGSRKRTLRSNTDDQYESEEEEDSKARAPKKQRRATVTPTKRKSHPTKKILKKSSNSKKKAASSRASKSLLTMVQTTIDTKVQGKIIVIVPQIKNYMAFRRFDLEEDTILLFADVYAQVGAYCRVKIEGTGQTIGHHIQEELISNTFDQILEDEGISKLTEDDVEFIRNHKIGQGGCQVTYSITTSGKS